MSSKDISYLELWRSLCSVELNHLCNISGGYHEEQFPEVILNLNQLFKRCPLKEFLSRALVALMFCRVKPFFAILVEGIMGNIHMK